MVNSSFNILKSRKRYDLTYRYGILQNLFNDNAGRRMALYITEYLKPQKFERMATCQMKIQTNIDLKGEY